ncbi:MAG: diguanylate cyclase [Roseiarcus sp.]|jgi:diguanylate cyclase (GGDEF)-like protein
MPTTAVTLEAVEAFMAARHQRLAFPDWLEQIHEAGKRERRSKRLAANAWELIVAYNLFLAADWLLTRDTLAFAATLHFFVVTPWMVFVALLFAKAPNRGLREAAACSLPIVVAAQILTIFLLSRSPGAAHYQYLVLMVVMYANAILRLPYRAAVAVSIVIFVCHAACVAFSRQLPAEAALLASAMIAASAYTTLWSNRLLERDERRSFLQALRDRLIHERTEIEATTDALTGLANRHRLRAKFAELWAGGADRPESVAIVMLDIDHFKAFNDRYGHPAGDACIKRVTSCALAELRGAQDLAARYGGEELLLVLPDATIATAVAVAERIRRSIEALGIPHELAGANHIVTASFGAAAAPISAVSADELVAAADAALYAAKAAGRNRVFPPLLRAAAAEPTSIGVARAGRMPA